MADVSTEILCYLNYEDGFYIECGANDGIRQSNTYLLEKQLNWSGILIEPSNLAWEECKKNRSNLNIIYNCALVSDDYSSTEIIGDYDGNLMASVHGKRLNNDSLISVRARTLTSILDECKIKKIDFFSLDVEGYELEVLKGLNFDKYRPIYILIEIYETDKDQIFEFMKKVNYKVVKNLSNFNYIDNPQWDGTHNDYLFKSL